MLQIDCDFTSVIVKLVKAIMHSNTEMMLESLVTKGLLREGKMRIFEHADELYRP